MEDAVLSLVEMNDASPSEPFEEVGRRESPSSKSSGIAVMQKKDRSSLEMSIKRAKTAIKQLTLPCE